MFWIVNGLWLNTYKYFLGAERYNYQNYEEKISNLVAVDWFQSEQFKSKSSIVEFWNLLWKGIWICGG